MSSNDLINIGYKNKSRNIKQDDVIKMYSNRVEIIKNF